MASGGGGEDGDFGFQIAPMVDVVFVLMLFFMACAGQQVIEKELKITLPSGKTSSDSNIKAPVFVDVNSSGDISVNGDPYDNRSDRDLPQLRQKLSSVVEADAEDPVIIRPQADTRHERVVDILNACAAAKVKNLSFASR